jgi:hypothetical protein
MNQRLMRSSLSLICVSSCAGANLYISLSYVVYLAIHSFNKFYNNMLSIHVAN